MPARHAVTYAPGVNLPEPDPGAAVVPDPSRPDARPGSEVPPGIDDAAGVLERIEADETAAREARDQYQLEPIAPMAAQPEGVGASVIGPGEVVYALRSTAILNAGRSDVPGYGGTLYLTERRLVLAGQVTMAIPLYDIVETALGGERLLLTLRNGEGVTLDVGMPRTLRAEIAAVRSLRRS